MVTPRTLLPLLALGLAAHASAQETPPVEKTPRPAWVPERLERLQLPPESRQFDFWVGAWDVNLRIQQPDLSWKDSIQADARVYPILFGKAVLELWDSPTIKGYSLRYYDPKRKEWVLWLNWPGQDRSGSSSLSGTFRHGRGDFQSVNERPDGSTSISRYSFNDITPHSLRWDDAYSDDGGKTWRNQWIMEFTRREAVPTLDPAGGPAHTFVDGSRATLPQFAHYAYLEGNFEGELVVTGIEDPIPVTWVGYKVLDGCAIISFLRFELLGTKHEVFHHLTWNTYANRFEATILEDSPITGAFLAYSAVDAENFVVQTQPDETGSQFRFTFGLGEGKQLALKTEMRTSADTEWMTRATATLRPGQP